MKHRLVVSSSSVNLLAVGTTLLDSVNLLLVPVSLGAWLFVEWPLLVYGEENTEINYFGIIIPLNYRHQYFMLLGP